MRILAYLFCMIIGHNKILEYKKDGKFSTYYTSCSQCQKKWFLKTLNTAPKIKFKKYSVKMRAQGQKMIIKIIEKEIPRKKQKVNFYAL